MIYSVYPFSQISKLRLNKIFAQNSENRKPKVKQCQNRNQDLGLVAVLVYCIIPHFIVSTVKHFTAVWKGCAHIHNCGVNSFLTGKGMFQSQPDRNRSEKYQLVFTATFCCHLRCGKTLHQSPRGMNTALHRGYARRMLPKGTLCSPKHLPLTHIGSVKLEMLFEKTQSQTQRRYDRSKFAPSPDLTTCLQNLVINVLKDSREGKHIFPQFINFITFFFVYLWFFEIYSGNFFLNQQG